MAAAPSWLKVTELRPQPPGPGITVNVQLVVDTPRKLLEFTGFAWTTARSISVASWWHRPAVFAGMMAWGVEQLFTRGSP